MRHYSDTELQPLVCRGQGQRAGLCPMGTPEATEGSAPVVTLRSQGLAGWTSAPPKPPWGPSSGTE